MLGVCTSHTINKVSPLILSPASREETTNLSNSSLEKEEDKAALVFNSVDLKSTTTKAGTFKRLQIALMPKHAPNASISILLWPITITLEALLINWIKESAKTRILTRLRFSWALLFPPINCISCPYSEITTWSPPLLIAISKAAFANSFNLITSGKSYAIPNEMVKGISSSLEASLTLSTIEKLSSFNLQKLS